MSQRWQDVGPPNSRGRMIALGHGRNVVLLASPLARAENYVPTFNALARHFRVHLIEMPGSGTGTRLKSPWTAANYASWACDVIVGHGLAGLAVIGQSYSGMTALTLAAQHPELVSALIVVDSSGFGEPASLVRGIGGAIFDAILDLKLVAAGWPLVAFNAVVHSRNFFTMIRESLGSDLSVLAYRAPMPTLVAWGGRSRFMRPSAARSAAGHLPNSRLYISANGVHTWAVSRAGEFASAVRAFLEGVPSES